MYLSQTLAKFACSTSFSDLSSEVIDRAKMAIVDYVGCAMAGSSHEIALPLQRYIEEVGGAPQASLIGLGGRTSVTNAALVNGVLGHALDYDDTNQIFIGHGTASIMAAILAVGEHRRLSGKAILLAYVIGTEIQWKLGEALVASGDHYAKGWHSTCTVGAFGAAGAVASLLGLDEESAANAFGIAASEAAGFQEQFGTHCKPFHAGRSNEIGVRAALLAKNGFTSSRTALDGERGFINMVADTYDLSKVGNFGKPWGILEPTYPRGLTMKKYPVCNSGSGAIEGVQSILERSGITAEDVESVDCEVRPGALHILIHHCPQTGLEAKFSVEFWVACTLLRGGVSLPDITDAAVQDPKVQSLMKKIVVKGNPEITVNNTHVRINVRLKDGRVLTEAYQPQKGAASNPLSADELKAKFFECASWGNFPQSNSDRAFRLMNELESLASVDELVQCICLPG